jgi:hypothetical protein
MWCTAVAYVHAWYGVYYQKGTDARGFSFGVQIAEDDVSHEEVPNDNATIQATLKQVKDGDLRNLNTSETLIIGRVKVFVNTHGDLLINILDGNFFVLIHGESESISNYPKYGKRTLLSDLLDTTTTVEAAAKLQSIVDEYGMTKEAGKLIKAELEIGYTPAWVLPTAICGGAVVLAAAVAVPAVILRRKKRGAAVADTPAEEENA